MEGIKYAVDFVFENIFTQKKDEGLKRNIELRPLLAQRNGIRLGFWQFNSERGRKVPRVFIAAKEGYLTISFSILFTFKGKRKREVARLLNLSVLGFL